MEIPGVPFIIDRKEYVYKIQFNIPDYFLWWKWDLKDVSVFPKIVVGS